MIERRHVLMFVTKSTQKLHHYDQIGERRRLWSLSQILSPGNDSCHVMSFFFQFTMKWIEIQKKLGFLLTFLQAEKVCEVLFWYKPNYWFLEFSSLLPEQ